MVGLLCYEPLLLIQDCKYQFGNCKKIRWDNWLMAAWEWELVEWSLMSLKVKNFV